MLIIGEKINPIRKDVARAITEKDRSFIRNMALKQVETGIDVLDLNAGNDPYRESENLRWLVEVVQEVADVPLALDSSNPEAIIHAFHAVEKKERSMVNSLKVQEGRGHEPLLKIIKDYNLRAVALCMDEKGMPKTGEERAEIGKRIVDYAGGNGIRPEQLFLDVVGEPISVDHANGRVALKALELIKLSLPGVQTVICIDAISFGLPNRRLLHRSYVPLLMAFGLDALFCDPLDVQLRATMKAAEAVLGKDEYCSHYITAYREGLLVM